jgi:hypothetical protein
MVKVGLTWVKDGWPGFLNVRRDFSPEYSPLDKAFDLHLHVYDDSWGAVRDAWLNETTYDARSVQ